MTKISEVVNLRTGYANFVELKSSFEAAQENADRMAMYRPTKSHRAAFERICRGLYQPTDKKFYLLSGSYGTGKSHLCLMTANFLSRSSGDPEIAGFYENYAKLDPNRAQLLKNIRKDGQYLVAICDYHSGRHFEDVVLKAVFEACAARGLDAGVDTEFNEAERLLADWEQKGDTGGIRDFYQDFDRALEAVAPGITVVQLREGLKNFDSDMLGMFRDAFREMMGGIPFQPQSGNLIPIIRQLIRSPAFKERFKGLAIFFDEFGSTLEKASYSKDILQGFMETICKNEPNVLFVGCIHKDFKAYSDRYSTEDAAVMSARLSPVDLFNEGIEEIIGAIVETDKQSAVWKKDIAPRTGVFNQLLPTCKTLNLFPWIEDVERIRQQVLEDIYGVHPMALACLLELSKEIGSDARSTFTFFSGDVGGDEGSYAEFIREADLITGSGKLNLYTVDQLLTFFRTELSQKNPELREGQRRAVNGYYASLDALRKTMDGELPGFQEDERLQVLKTILIYQLCQIPTSLGNIQFGLYCLSNSEKDQVKQHMQDLVKKGAVFYRQQSKTYELAVSTGEDPYDLIERYVDNPQLHPADTLQTFLDEAGDKSRLAFCEARGYNLPFGEDKRFRTRFVRARDLGPGLWEDITKDYTENRSQPDKSFEGTLVYALCEDEGDIAAAREVVKSIPVSTIALAVPHNPQPFTDQLLRVKACRHYLPPNEAQKISAQAESRLRDILENQQDGYLPILQRVFNAIADGSEACWYGQDGKVLVDKPKQYHQPADMVCEALFTRRCRIKHPDLNYCHDDKWRTGKNPALKQAVEVLLNAERVLIDNGNPDNHGQKRYLEKVLLKGAGGLKKSGSEGAVSYFVCETNPAKIHDDFPVLKALCAGLANQITGKTLSVGAFLAEAGGPPYGASGTPLLLSLAHVIRAYGEQLIVYKDSTRMAEQSLQSYEDLVRIVSDPAAKTVFGIRRISQPQRTLVDLVANAVDAPPLKYGEVRTLQAACDALGQWWQHLPAVARIISLYPEAKRARLDGLRKLLNAPIGGVDRFDFLLRQLPDLYLLDPVGDNLTEADAQAVASAFTEDVKLLKSGLYLAQAQLAQVICEVFGTYGDMVVCEGTVKAWHEALKINQRQPHHFVHEGARQLLARLANDSTAFSVMMGTLLAKDYGFGNLADWTSLHFKDYAAKLQQAKVEIDTAGPVVPKPPIDEGVYEVGKAEKKFVGIPDGAAGFIYTMDGSDPRHSSNAQKTSTGIEFTNFLKDGPSAKINIITVDKDGNTSDVVHVELVDKEHIYEVQISKTFWGTLEAKFKWPDDTEGVVAVLKSVISNGVKKNLLRKDVADQITDVLDNLDQDH